VTCPAGSWRASPASPKRYIAQIEAGRGNVSIVLLLRLAQAIRE
jgi:hypothetical protein